MADEEQAQEKTEQPSHKRLKEAKEKGQVARSKDLNATLILLFSGSAFLLFGQYLSSQFMTLMRRAFEFDSQIIKTPWDVSYVYYFIIKNGFMAVLPLFLVILLLAILAPLAMGGWVFSTESLKPQFSRLNPLKGLKRMVSIKSVVELVKALAKFILIAAVSLMVLQWKLPALLSLTSFPLASAINQGSSILISIFMIISGSLILIAALDVPFQWYEHQKQLKMTRQELKEEYKETEGKPEIKSQIRRAQQAIAKRRMMSQIAKSTVVLTNPTHYAVAISYTQHSSKAPVVVAKGKDLIAFQIQRVAKSHEVPILSVPPLTRAIYFSTDLDKEIPHGLYVAVAQVLAYLFRLKDKNDYDAKPSIFNDLPIPEDLRRHAEDEKQ